MSSPTTRMTDWGVESGAGWWRDDQQKDNLCGPFWGARLLHRAGVTRCDGEPVDQDLVATRAGTTLPETQGDWVPPGAMARLDYTRPLIRARAEEAGTAPGALAKAIEEVSGGSLHVIPVTGRFDQEQVERLVAKSRALDLWLIANVRTGMLWGSRPDPDTVYAELAGEPQKGPDPDWDVGHFVELQMLLRGPGGSLVVVGDSYPSLGWQGRHLQPPRAVALALERGDGRGGGVLVVGPCRAAAATAGLANELGLEVRNWDNGSRTVAGVDDPRNARSRK